MNTVKKNIIYSSILLGVGVVLLIISLIGVLPEDSLGSTVFGMGCGFTAVGLGNTILGLKNYKNHEKAEEIELIENDERNILLREKTSAKVYSIFSYIECGIILLAALLGYKEISLVLSVLVLGQLITWIFVANYYSKKY